MVKRNEQVKIALKTALCCMIIEQERSCDKKRPFQKVNQTLYLLIKQNGIYFVSFYKTSPSHVTQIIFSHIKVTFGYSKVINSMTNYVSIYKINRTPTIYIAMQMNCVLL